MRGRKVRFRMRPPQYVYENPRRVINAPAHHHRDVNVGNSNTDRSNHEDISLYRKMEMERMELMRIIENERRIGYFRGYQDGQLVGQIQNSGKRYTEADIERARIEASRASGNNRKAILDEVMHQFKTIEDSNPGMASPGFKAARRQINKLYNKK